MAKLTQGGVKTALQRTHGNISAAARMLNVSRRAIAKRIDADPELTQAVTDAPESMVDEAEAALLEANSNGAVSQPVTASSFVQLQQKTDELWSYRTNPE